MKGTKRVEGFSVLSFFVSLVPFVGERMTDVGIIAIGRNEGERLRRCLASVLNRGRPVIYVDSASSDGSPKFAAEMGADVVALDMSIPFSAARARNEGMAKLLQNSPDVQYVLMVDGDCEVVDGFIERAVAELEANPKAAVVCGRRRERFPEASIYNRLADVEWNTPIGEAKSCGGDAVFRVSAFRQAGGFDSSIVAGEEPELCQRLREKGWKVFRIDAEMTIHDSAMTRFGQWWKRAVRSGYGAMDVATRFRGPDQLFVKQVKSAQRWVQPVVFTLVLLCSMALVGAIFENTNGPSTLFISRTIRIATLILFPLFLLAMIGQALRISLRMRRRVPDMKTALAYGTLTMIGKWANYRGQRQYLRDRKAGKISRMIDYKSAGTPAAAV
jgi:cellulose synthase/poly-beta-1,6-N-acetylglucosamine synthase-like glycosyltransferase